MRRQRLLKVIVKIRPNQIIIISNLIYNPSLETGWEQKTGIFKEFDLFILLGYFILRHLPGPALLPNEIKKKYEPKPKNIQLLLYFYFQIPRIPFSQKHASDNG